jgi:tRNA modification GTPase
MHPNPRDTIAAIGTAPGGAARGMIRLSGPKTLACVEGCFRPNDISISFTEIRSAQFVAGELHFGQEGITLPCDLLLWPNKQSYTRQPSAELHTIGSPPLLEMALQMLCRHGSRVAEPGEFTLRAFLAGRLDLTQAEAVLGVIDAADPASFDAALSQLAGGLSQPLTRLREQLLELLAHLEAGLDFVEEDITFISAVEIERQLTAAQETIADTLAQLANRSEPEILSKVALIGAPNAGKSRLFNVLLDRHADSDAREAAIVSPQAGTTRDYLTAAMNVNGRKFQLIDTAGFESTTSVASIEHRAQEMTSGQRRQAFCTIYCIDATDLAIQERVAEQIRTDRGKSDLYVLTKIDLLTEDSTVKFNPTMRRCSSRTGEGIAELVSAVVAALNDDAAPPGAVASTAARCADSLHRAEESVQAALSLVAAKGGDELIAVEIRTALNELGRVVGAVYTDDLLDRIFSQFCIGK